MWRLYADLTKFGIVVFVMLAGLAGYGMSFSTEAGFDLHHLLWVMGGLYFLSSGSLALNQVQEFKNDRLMPRTSKRPIASGKLKPAAGLILAVAMLVIGADLLFRASTLAGVFGLLTVALYNGAYTYWWKPKMAFSLIPGSIPGALPVTIGYVANSADFLSVESIYLFAILFFWQVPHFLALAIKFQEDYQLSNTPNLPSTLGIDRTLYHMGLWTFGYVLLAVGSPIFVHVGWVYLAIILPISFKLLQEFRRFQLSQGKDRWLVFFMWINISVLVFLFVPTIDKWSFLLTSHS